MPQTGKPGLWHDFMAKGVMPGDTPEASVVS